MNTQKAENPKPYDLVCIAYLIRKEPSVVANWNYTIFSQLWTIDYSKKNACEFFLHISIEEGFLRVGNGTRAAWKNLDYFNDTWPLEIEIHRLNLTVGVLLPRTLYD